MTVMVLGGNGQLGTASVAELVSAGVPVRATVRSRDRAGHLTALGADLVELVEVDLASQPDRRRAALGGVDTVVMSANSVVPRAGDDPGGLETAMLDLVEEMHDAGVRRVVLPSVPRGGDDAEVPMVAARRDLEERLLASPLDAWVLRMPPFMECCWPWSGRRSRSAVSRRRPSGGRLRSCGPSGGRRRRWWRTAG